MVIISQDKTKTTQRLEFYIQENFGTDEELQYEIRNIGGGSFGGYKTEERAKEVLQEITITYQNFKMYESCTDISGQAGILRALRETNKDLFIYEMPEE